MAKLIIIRGPAGSGKSSIAKKLHGQAIEETAYLPVDLFRVDIAKEQTNAAEIAADIISYCAKKFLDNGYTVIIESMFDIRKKRWNDLLTNLVNYKNVEAKLFYLQITEDEAVRRNSARQKGAFVSEDEIRQWYALSQPTGWDNEEIIDTEANTLDAIVDKIATETQLTLDPNNYKTKIHTAI